MYACLYVYYVCMYVCMYVYMYLCMYVCNYVYIFLGRPAYLRGLLTRRNILPHLRSSDATLLDLPVTSNVMRSRSFTSMAHTTWNQLPYRLRRLKSPHVFANSLKDIIPSGIKQYFYGISDPGYSMVHNSLWHKSVLLWDI